jgi:hypothetical protein
VDPFVVVLMMIWKNKLSTEKLSICISKTNQKPRKLKRKEKIKNCFCSIIKILQRLKNKSLYKSLMKIKKYK